MIITAQSNIKTIGDLKNAIKDLDDSEEIKISVTSAYKFKSKFINKLLDTEISLCHYKSYEIKNTVVGLIKKGSYLEGFMNIKFIDIGARNDTTRT